jgi:predicted HicB family RNase H-like nuclease
MTSQRQQTYLDFQPVFEALEKPLALVSDEERRAQYQLLLESSRLYQEKAVLNLVSSVVTAMSEAGGVRGSIEVQGDGYVLNIERETAEPEPVFDASDEVERVTLRLPRKLKEAIDKMAERSGHSTNTWYVHTLSRSLAHQLRGAAFGMGAGMQPGETPWGWRGRGRRRGGMGRAEDASEVD